MMIKIITLIGLFTLSFTNASANAEALKLRGSGVYKFLFLKVYKATLWTDKEKDIFQGNIKLQLEYLRDLKGVDIFDQTAKELANAKHSDQEIKNWMSSIENVFPNVTDGDKITAFYKPNHGILFFFNETKPIGEIRDKKFAIAFMNIWLGEKSSSQKFRKKLLGGR